MKNRLRWILLCVGLLAAVRLPAQTKRALVIGLGQQADRSWSKINGDRDVPVVRKMLTAAGFRQIQTLVNRQATKAGIVSAFRRLTAQCRRGDIVYIHFSGHGQQMTDLNGDEPDQLDEAWIPYDAYKKYGVRDRGEKHLSDDELARMLTAVRQRIGATGSILVVVDACHSGSSTRGEVGDSVAVRGTWDRFVIPQTGKSKSVAGTSQHWMTISACKDYQNNYELSGLRMGKLTCGLVQAVGSRRGLTNQQVEEALKQFMRRNPGRAPQTPVLSGTTGGKCIADILQPLKK